MYPKYPRAVSQSAVNFSLQLSLKNLCSTKMTKLTQYDIVKGYCDSSVVLSRGCPVSCLVILHVRWALNLPTDQPFCWNDHRSNFHMIGLVPTPNPFVAQSVTDSARASCLFFISLYNSMVPNHLVPARNYLMAP